MSLRHDYTPAEVLALLGMPLFELIDQARRVHCQRHAPNEVELCTLLNVKTGGCSEDCGYCSQSIHHPAVKSEPLMGLEEVVSRAEQARAQGSVRLCMGAAWSRPRSDGAFERVLTMIRAVKAVGLETCVPEGRRARCL
jgi:biotin synthase